MKRNHWSACSTPLFSEANPEPPGGGGALAAPPASNTPPPQAFNSDGTFAENWTTALGDEFSPHADALKNFKDVKGLAKSYLHFRSTGPTYPGDGATDDDVARFRGLAQVPATPEAYGLTVPDGATDSDKAVIDRIAKAAHKAHIPAPAMKSLFEEFNAIQAEQLQALNDEWTAKQKAAEDALVSEWRGNYEPNKAAVRHLATTLATQVGVDPQDAGFTEMVNNPAFAKIMLQVSKLTQEDRILAPSGLGDLRSNQQRAEAIMDGSDPIWGKKYVSGSHDEQMAAYNEVKRLLTTK